MEENSFWDIIRNQFLGSLFEEIKECYKLKLIFFYIGEVMYFGYYGEINILLFLNL